MARYIGPKLKISRRYGTKLGLRTNEEAFTRRPYKPGQHGPSARRGKVSEYGLQLLEKQKAKYIYGILERQFHNYYVVAAKAQNAGLALMQLLETRLDTVVARAGYAVTQNQARQFVTHGHVQIDGKKVSIPSFQVKPGMRVTIDKDLLEMVSSQRGSEAVTPDWITITSQGAEVASVPTRDQISPLINEQLIIEFYSR
jgi:small subunit ribosomal protein S4